MPALNAMSKVTPTPIKASGEARLFRLLERAACRRTFPVFNMSSSFFPEKQRETLFGIYVCKDQGNCFLANTSLAFPMAIESVSKETIPCL